ncbi:hypothetical protein H0G86_004417 [Trichoderma simmonsii]|uniref:Uncharacterized protein n=1 Tax=Trichoderma simmonsii TaxID=1491479 RepID=A0A8G0PE48_9HYPO|nr:hypothetical protein H0G86_004417 [Trichoderma simmonsii]
MYKYRAALKCAAVRAGTATPAPSKKNKMPSHWITPLIPLVARPSVSEIVWTGLHEYIHVQYGARDVEQVIGLLVMDGVSVSPREPAAIRNTTQWHHTHSVAR